MQVKANSKLSLHDGDSGINGATTLAKKKNLFLCTVMTSCDRPSLSQNTGQLCTPTFKKKIKNLEGCQDPDCLWFISTSICLYPIDNYSSVLLLLLELSCFTLEKWANYPHLTVLSYSHQADMRFIEVTSKRYLASNSSFQLSSAAFSNHHNYILLKLNNLQWIPHRQRVYQKQTIFCLWLFTKRQVKNVLDVKLFSL